MSWSEVALIDWRAAHTAVGDTDLNFVGSSFTYAGVTWRTPSVARGNSFNQVASVAWDLLAAGLVCESPDNSRMAAANANAPHVYASLSDLATAYGFVADPTRKYFWQCFISGLAGTTASPAQSGAGAAIYRVDQGVALGNASLLKTALGQMTPRNFMTGGKSVSPAAVALTTAEFVAAVFYNGSGSYLDGYVGAMNGSAFPEPADMTPLGQWRDTGTDNDNDMVGDPDFMRFAAFHNQETFSPNAYVGTIQQSRLLQLG